ncbi:efflux RND transporter periplasmic adaptor subunit [Desulfovibrio aminophilus]|nr:efflux RND transporter periplasmic adaptor subunit [Desulfovibrio aminophilus]MCM0754556.1 efflux RND transporter periplasmic adaptor subunit [Desulfovibrio aminophilus]
MSETDLSKLSIDKSAWNVPGKRRRFPRRLLVLLLLAGAGLAAYLVLPLSTTVETTSVTRVAPSLGLTVLNSSGYVTAQRKASVASKTTAVLTWLGVEEGSRVREGEVIARLEHEDVQAAKARATAELHAAEAAVEAARAELADATLNYKRLHALVDKKLVAQADFDAARARFLKAQADVNSAQANVRSAHAALGQAEANLGYTLLRAPFDAVVLTKNADIGDIITPLGAAANAKASVVTIADMSSLLVETDVSESSVGKVHTGQPCEILLDAVPGERFLGFVHMIVPTADRSKASVMVKVAFDHLDPRMLPEMSAKVAFLSRPLAENERELRPAVPAAALARRGDRDVVFVVADGVARATQVEPGERLGDFVELRKGPAEDVRLVLNPPDSLADGAKVTVR